MKSKYFSTPVSFSMLKSKFLKINKNFRKVKKNLINLDFEKTLNYLIKERAIHVKEDSVGLNLEYVILKSNKNKIN
ncbi:MAG: hypothetical protein GY786_01040 [Proteobacteria bacterium]|nr:hypothetical protein [Pseudomonadota bacterium]